jgi:hypothetical protein
MHTSLGPDSRASHNGGTPLPLFRQEALLHQQQKFYGDVILIRPLSLTLLTWGTLAIVALAVGLLGFVRYTEKLRLPATGAGATANQIELHVPARWLSLFKPGAQISVRCRGCSSPVHENGTVLAISSTPLTPAANPEQTYKITVSLPAPAAQNLAQQPGAALEAEIPLGRKPLIHWFFSRPAS